MLVPTLLLTSPLAAQDNDASAATSAQAEEKTAPVADSNFVVRMKNNKFLRGVPVDLAFIDVYVLGTKIPIPIDQIAGVRFAQADGEKGTVALTNGEMLSGRIETPKIHLAVDWGEAKINPGVITGIVRSVDMQWSMRNSPSGPQWYLSPRNMRSSGIYNHSQFDSMSVAANYAAQNRDTVSNSNVAPVSYAAPISDATSNMAFPVVNAREFAWIW